MKCEACGGTGSTRVLDFDAMGRDRSEDAPCGPCGGSGVLDLSPRDDPEVDDWWTADPARPYCRTCGTAPGRILSHAEDGSPILVCRPCLESKKETR